MTKQHELPKTKKEFVAFLQTLSVRKRFDVGHPYACALHSFLTALGGQGAIVGSTTYDIDGHTFSLPKWAKDYTDKACKAQDKKRANKKTGNKTVGVVELRKVLETVK